MSDDAVDVLARGLDQAARLLGDVSDDRLGEPTPCADWDVADLVDHLVRATANFGRTVRGQEVDWLAPTPHIGPDRVDVFRAEAADLLAAWREHGAAGGSVAADWQSAELAVHTYDLATALGRSTADLDPAPAERGLVFMQANREPETRGNAFGAEQPAPEGADAYQRIAAFAGRSV
jgi:uncharacterized protein (TIGR03086 family)